MANIKEKAALAGATNNTLPEHLKTIGFAAVMRGQINQVVRKKDPAASVYSPVATVEAVVLADDAKATSILRAYARVGTVTGALTVVAPGTTPATTEISIQPNGDIMVLAADAITSLDVTFVPERGDVDELPNWPVASDAIALPARITTPGAILLLEAESLEGTLTGKLRVLAPSASAAATGQARLNLAKTSVKFAPADAVTKARVKLLVCAAVDLDTVLESDATIQ
jgi:hypothetical protein